MKTPMPSNKAASAIAGWTRKLQPVAIRCNLFAPPNMRVNGRIDRVVALRPPELGAEDVGGGLIGRLLVPALGR